MRRKFLYSSLLKQYLQPELVTKLEEILPENNKVSQFSVFLYEDDERNEQLRQLLAEHGVQYLKDGAWDYKSACYMVDTYYEYEPVDLECADYFMLYEPEFAMADKQIRPDGRLWIQVNDSTDGRVSYYNIPDRHIGAAVFGWFLVSPTFRRAIESRKLIGPVFEDTVPFYRDADLGTNAEDAEPVDWAEVGWGPLYIMGSHITLPPVHPDIKLTSFHGREEDWVDYPRDTEGPAKVREGRWPPSELHYLRSEMEEVEPFDVGRVRASGSKIKYRPDAGHQLVFSRRFYDLCNEMGLKLTWHPVYLEDD
ncbi:MAG: hypothetical protein AAGG38_00335 [Planctomycetota bacterium]